MIPTDRLQQIKARLEFVEAQMSTGEGDIVALGREHAELSPVVRQITEYERLVADIAEAEAMLADPEMKALAEEELPELPEEEWDYITTLPGYEVEVQVAEQKKSDKLYTANFFHTTSRIHVNAIKDVDLFVGHYSRFSQKPLPVSMRKSALHAETQWIR